MGTVIRSCLFTGSRRFPSWPSRAWPVLSGRKALLTLETPCIQA